jgi:hydrogenase maturation protease
MPRISVIGIGNTLKADDGVGVRVAEELSSLDLGADVDVVSGELAGMLLAPYFINSDHVIVVDAIDAGDTAGSVFRFHAEDGLPMLRSHTSHGISVTELVTVARLSGSKAEILIFAVQVEDVRPMSEGLSETVEAVVPEVVQMVRDEVAAIRSGDDRPGAPRAQS